MHSTDQETEAWGSSITYPRLSNVSELGSEPRSGSKTQTVFFYPHPRTFFIVFRENRRERWWWRGEGERNVDVREKHLLGAFSYVPRLGMEPTT